MTRRLLYALLGALFILHNDVWLWGDARLVAGLPAGLAYHVGLCLATAVVFAAIVRWAWPTELVQEERESDAP